MILTDAPNQAGISAKAARRDGLVESLSSGENMKSLAEDRFTRNRKMGDMCNVIDVETPLHEDTAHIPSLHLHCIRSLRAPGVVGRFVSWLCH